jgi:hypothetical protein
LKELTRQLMSTVNTPSVMESRMTSRSFFSVTSPTRETFPQPSPPAAVPDARFCRR